ncbi:ABC transporter permease/ATP-binding protein [Myxococcus stipitatus DSM 14675]|uniref:ABC transporter permease/ATP-binding protein n=1 Tax=Myxococcus stipitatus (strain DSM 14675 / JCM 12634 / Mx s8) TaxID=1278073 RepID=L7ULM7_MYXSD|nr:ABC transporter ATP-binding protein [Myxococcus stipitatus]AGC48815.1 ABC transporter permease/ATP-binding protein [Myxococcus stipitatus DSM 14675]
MSPPPIDSTTPAKSSLKDRLKSAGSLFRQLPGTFRIFWQASPRGAVVLGALTLVAALLPAAIAWVGKLIVDAVVAAAQGSEEARSRVFGWVGLEFALMLGSAVVERGLMLTRELLRANLGNVLNERILQKALDLELQHFEDSNTYDKMQNARREASSRPLSLVMQAFSIVRNGITLSTFAALLVALSPWSVVVLVAASIPAFIAEARLAMAGFRLYSWRAPEGRKLNYLEWILTRDSHVKEVKLFGLGDLVLGRYRELFKKFFAEDRALAFKRMGWGLGLGVLSLGAFYGCYVFVAGRAASGAITVGDMVLYLAVFRQGQSAFQGILTSVGSMYEDALFMSNLFTYLEIPTGNEVPRVLPAKSPARGRMNDIELRGVSFRYPGKEAWALRNVSLTLRPGQKLALVGENGAGKSTLVKLLLRLYEPTEGTILYGGVDIRDMDVGDLRGRFGAVFQDFVRYQFNVAENIGLGHVPALEDRPRIEKAAEQGGASGVIAALPGQYDTMLGGWFEKGQELSSGQWQKLAVARAFMRDDAEVLILDEPTASIDAEAEHALFERFQALAADRIAIVISHRFSTVRMADQIAVLHNGGVDELGSHDALMAKDGRYAHLFRLQARGYRD